MEWAIEKATELGVSRITPILARRTEKHLALAAPKRAERWRRIALEAAKQSRRTDIPEIADPTQLKQALEHETSPTRILLSETEQAPPSPPHLKTHIRATKARVPHPSQSHREGWDADSQLALAIGPEGGWTPEEMSLFTQARMATRNIRPSHPPSRNRRHSRDSHRLHPPCLRTKHLLHPFSLSSFLSRLFIATIISKIHNARY